MWVKILLLFFVFSYLFRTDHAFDQDLGRHLKLGEIIFQTQQIPKVNLFSYTNPDFPFINTHWLFEVFIFLANQTVGLQVVLILKVIIFLFSVFLILKIVPKQNSDLLLPVGFIFLHVLRERLELRPEIFSFLFTASTFFILEKFLKDKTKWIFTLPLIQLLWINTHIYFFVGLTLQAIFILHLASNLASNPWGLKLKKLILIFGLSVLVSLINLNGLTGLLYPLNVTQNYGYTIAENQTMFLLESINFRNANFLFVKISIGLIILSLVTALIRRKFELKNILLTLLGMALALMNVRSFPYLAFLSLPATLANFSLGSLSGPPPRWTTGWTVRGLSFVFGAVLIWESFLYLSGDYYKSRDDENRVGLKITNRVGGAMDFVLKQDLPGPIYNNFDIGSYIIYRGYPKYQVFVDGRPEAYPKEFFQNTYIPMQSDFAKFKQEEQKWGFKTIIFSHTDQTPWGRNFLQAIVKDDSWKLIYFDDFMLVLVKSDVLNQKKLTAINLAEVSPQSFKFDSHVQYLRMGYFLLSTQNTQAAEQFIQKAAQIYPKSPIINSLRR